MTIANMSDPSKMTGATVYGSDGTVRKEQIDQVEVEGAAGERGLRGENRN
jgi:hypothetical protein